MTSDTLEKLAGWVLLLTIGLCVPLFLLEMVFGGQLYWFGVVSAVGSVTTVLLMMVYAVVQHREVEWEFRERRRRWEKQHLYSMLKKLLMKLDVI